MNWKIKNFVVITFWSMFVLWGVNAQAQISTFNIWGCTSSGSPGLDATINKDIEVLNFLFNTRVGGCIQEGSDSVKYDSSNNMVIIGKNQLGWGSELTTAGNLWPVPWALAHEYAHSMQEARGFPYPPDSKWRELHADFMAGWFLSFRLRYVYQDFASPIIVAWKNGSSQSHGGRWERVVATALGITCNRTIAKTDATAAYNAGLIFVTALKAKANE